LKEIIKLHDLHTDYQKEKTNQLFSRGGNCVRMDMGMCLKNKIITVTYTCAV